MDMSHFPTQSFGGNAAWLVMNTIDTQPDQVGHQGRSAWDTW